MKKVEFRNRLIESTKILIESTESMVTNSISQHVKYSIEPNDREASEHLSKFELDKLKELNQVHEKQFNVEEVVNLLNESELVPLWINIMIDYSTKKYTIVKLICSRRLRNNKDLYDNIDQFPPFHPLIPMPPWRKKDEKFNINWKHQKLKRKWYALIWKLRNRKS